VAVEDTVMRVIAMLSRKGGVGKTTTLFNLGVALGERGRRVLIVDLDSLAAVTRWCGQLRAGALSLGHALSGQTTLASVIVPTAFTGLWIAPGSPGLVSIEDSPNLPAARRRADGGLRVDCLAAELGSVAGLFDYVLLDCPSGHLFMEQLALVAADEVIIPTGPSVIDLYGAAPTLQLVGLAQSRRSDGRPSLLGFLPNEIDRAGVPEAMQQALAQYGLPCFSPIRHSALLRTLPGRADVRERSIQHVRGANPAAQSFQTVAREIDAGMAVVREPAALPAARPAASADRTGAHP
jgi:chromosome partitioning protein